MTSIDSIPSVDTQQQLTTSVLTDPYSKQWSIVLAQKINIIEETPDAKIKDGDHTHTTPESLFENVIYNGTKLNTEFLKTDQEQTSAKQLYQDKWMKILEAGKNAQTKILKTFGKYIADSNISPLNFKLHQNLDARDKNAIGLYWDKSPESISYDAEAIKDMSTADINRITYHELMHVYSKAFMNNVNNILYSSPIYKKGDSGTIADQAQAAVDYQIREVLIEGGAEYYLEAFKNEFPTATFDNTPYRTFNLHENFGDIVEKVGKEVAMKAFFGNDPVATEKMINAYKEILANEPPPNLDGFIDNDTAN